jgi:hypothetical protein
MPPYPPLYFPVLHLFHLLLYSDPQENIIYTLLLPAGGVYVDIHTSDDIASYRAQTHHTINLGSMHPTPRREGGKRKRREKGGGVLPGLEGVTAPTPPVSGMYLRIDRWLAPRKVLQTGIAGPCGSAHMGRAGWI